MDRHELYGVVRNCRGFGRIVLAQLDEAEVAKERFDRTGSVEWLEGMGEVQEPEEVLMTYCVDHTPEAGFDDDGLDGVDHRAPIHNPAQ